MNPNLYQHVQTLRPGTALDLGAGHFFDVACLKQLGWDATGVDKNTGIDLNASYIAPDGPFDFVYSCFVLHLLEQPQQLFDTAYANLLPGGKFFLQTFSEEDTNVRKGFTEESLRMFAQAFFNVKLSTYKQYDNEVGHQHWHFIRELTGERPSDD